jgi:hypothetical protein
MMGCEIRSDLSLIPPTQDDIWQFIDIWTPNPERKGMNYILLRPTADAKLLPHLNNFVT